MEPERPAPAFTAIGPVYDRLMEDVPYRDWVRYLERLFHTHGLQPRTLLDLGCGTGRATVLFLRKGYRVVALDRSRSMLQVARERFHAFPQVACMQADARTFALRHPVDAVISMFDTLNNFLNESDLLQVFRQVHRALRPGGLFTFDMNTPWCLAHIWGDDVKVKEHAGIISIWRTQFSAHPPRARLWITLFVPDRDGRYRRLDEEHEERGYSLDTLHRLLNRAGFRGITMYRHLSFRPARERDPRIQVLAWKPEV